MASAFRSASRMKQGGNRDELQPLLYAQPNQFSTSAQSFNSNRLPYYNPFAGGSYQFSQTSEPVNPSKVIHQDGDLGKDPHSQFCALTGCPPSNADPDTKFKVNPKSLYGRALHQKRSQDTTYAVTAALTNTLLLLQIVLGAALTGLGGSHVPPYVITVFGATNTVIAGLVTYLKSRGQPNRARMFKDDLERVVDEMENSEVMWLGIAKGVHGYDDIDTDDTVTVRSEVARLTRLYDRAIRTNTANNPDSYNAGAAGGDASGSANRGGGGPFLTLPAMNLPPVDGPSGSGEQAAAPKPPADDADAAPATAPAKKKDEDSKPKEGAKPETPAAGNSKDATKTPADADKSKSAGSAPAPAAAATATPAPAAAKPPAGDPDASPATMTQVRKKSATQVPKKEAGEPE